ncbi:MAG TPA: hypothetical protein VMT32_07780 [Bryobacteraceae bacterium]|nr:hypothetical protein [Bryobacteraceae bacterium]
MPVPRIFFLLPAAILLHAASAPFAILKPTISDMEDGPGVPPSFTFVPGQFVFLSFEVGGYQVSPERKIHLSYKVDAFDPKGVPIVETMANTLDTTLSEEDKNWKPKMRQQILLPPLAGSGTYKIAIQVTDDLAKATVSQQISLQVRGHEVEPSDTLTIRNFHFYRGEEDRDPLAVAAYKPGDTLFARFDITGYKFGPHNSVDVDYGLSVVAPSGKVLFTQEKAAEEKSSSFYPKAYVPGSMNLNIYKDTKPGQYTMVLTARDHTGNQTYEAKGTFTVE